MPAPGSDFGVGDFLAESENEVQLLSKASHFLCFDFTPEVNALKEVP